jgi:hypothetical protein
MVQQDLLDEIYDYLNDDMADGALFINGSWGVGKSYFINNTFLKDYLGKHNQSKIVPIISLKGISSTNDIRKVLFRDMHPLITKMTNSHVAKGTEKLLKKVKIKDILTLDLSGYFYIDETIKKKINLLIFDDLERCKLPIYDILSSISNLMEECQSKAIIIGNEREIISYQSSEEIYRNQLLSVLSSKPQQNNVTQDNKNVQQSNEDKDLYYYKIKEKTIWKTISFLFNPNVFFDGILPSYAKQDTEATSLAIANKELLLNLLGRFQCENLRVCKSAMENFIAIKKKLLPLVASLTKKETDLVYKNFLLSTFSSTLKSRCGIKLTSLDEEGVFLQSSLFVVKDFESVTQFVTCCSWSNKLFLKDIKQIQNEVDNGLPKVLADLDVFWVLLGDEEVKKRYKAMIEEFDEGKIDCGLIYLVYHYSYEYSEDYKFDGGPNASEVFEKCLLLIHKETKKINTDTAEFRLIGSNSGDRGRIQELLNATKERNRQIGEVNLNNHIKDSAVEFSPEELQETKENAINNHCFMACLDLDGLVSTLKVADNKKIESIREIFHEVYLPSNISDFFQGDKDSLIDLKMNLDTLVKSEKSMTKRKLLSWFHDDVQSYLEKLK